MSKQSSKLFFLPGQVSVRSMVAAAVLTGLSGLAIAGKFDGYKPNAFVGRMVSEADVFEEAMVKGTSEGILTGETARLMQQKLQVTTPIRMKATKGEVDAKGCQVMITSMWVRDIHAPAMGVDKGDYRSVRCFQYIHSFNSHFCALSRCENAKAPFGGRWFSGFCYFRFHSRTFPLLAKHAVAGSMRNGSAQTVICIAVTASVMHS